MTAVDGGGTVEGVGRTLAVVAGSTVIVDTGGASVVGAGAEAVTRGVDCGGGGGAALVGAAGALAAVVGAGPVPLSWKTLRALMDQ